MDEANVSASVTNIQNWNGQLLSKLSWLIAQPVTREVVSKGTTVSKIPTITGSENFLVDDFFKSKLFNLSIYFNEQCEWSKGFSLPYLCAGYL